jgi:hypothetical protein
MVAKRRKSLPSSGIEPWLFSLYTGDYTDQATPSFQNFPKNGYIT